MNTKPEQITPEQWRIVKAKAQEYAKPHRHTHRHLRILEAYRAGMVDALLTVCNPPSPPTPSSELL